MQKKELSKKIDTMRAELHDMIEQYGIDSNIVLNFSQKLDTFICELDNMETMGDFNIQRG